MFAPNVDRILAAIRPPDVVLDVGGWACPFNRADHVIDAEPYETRGYYKTVGLPASQGGDREHFTAATWHRRDICAKEPFPFPDKSIDFVICSHVLEDIRDPLWVCAEMIRVAKRGYVEVPSRLAETCRGWESDRIAGLSHHRWLVDVDEPAAAVRFTPKYHMIHAHPRFNLPPRFFRDLPEERKVSYLFWEGSFTFAEVSIHGLGNIAAELEGFATRHRPPPRWRLGAGRVLGRVGRLLGRVTGRPQRARGHAD
jgi:hypothetical protein